MGTIHNCTGTCSQPLPPPQQPQLQLQQNQQQRHQGTKLNLMIFLSWLQKSTRGRYPGPGEMKRRLVYFLNRQKGEKWPKPTQQIGSKNSHTSLPMTLKESKVKGL